MRDVPDEALGLITEPKEAGVRATFRKTLPVFERFNMPFSGFFFEDDKWIDACTYGTGILRVMSSNNYLLTQYVQDIHGTWPEWTYTGIALWPGSVPAVDDGYVWYEKSDGDVNYRHYGSWATEVNAYSFDMPLALAPIGNRCWGLSQEGTKSSLMAMSYQPGDIYHIFGLTSLPRVDAVSFGGKEYFYTMDRDAGRVIEIKHAGNAVSGKDCYGVGKSIVPIDAIDDVYGFKLSYASVVDDAVVVTGRLTRTSDDAPVSFEAYAAGPEFFSFGREMFIQSDVVAPGKMLRVGDYFVVSSHNYYWIAKATAVFVGESHPDLEIMTSDLANFSMTEAEGRSTNLDMEVSTALSHQAVATGSDVELEMAYNNHWTKLTTCAVDQDRLTIDEQGRTRVLSGIGKSAKRLAQWSPDQGVYIPSQARMYDFPANMTHVIRATGLWEKSYPEEADSPIQLKDLNKLGVLYSTARASRGGAMRALFSYPSDSYFKPYFGVVINYYREAAAEAAERLGMEVSELEDDIYGHNGIAAIYSPTEHGGTPGIALYLWRDSVLTKVTSTPVTFAAGFWYWLQIEFIEGKVLVKYHLEGNNTWTEAILYRYYHAADLPWKRESLGRGAVIVKNIVPETACYPLGPDDMCLGVDSNSAFPSTGTLRVDGERMSYSSKSSATPPADFAAGVECPPGWSRSPKLFWLNNTSICTDVPSGFLGDFALATRHRAQAWDGTTTSLYELQGKADHLYDGLAMVLLPSAKYGGALYYLSSGNRTARLQGYDNVVPQHWSTNDQTYPPGWEGYIGNATKGVWALWTDMSGLHVDIDLRAACGFGSDPLEGYSRSIQRGIFALTRAFHLSGRGANDTVATSHGISVARYDAGKYVQVSIAASFSQDEDQTIEEALKTIVHLAGGKASCQSVVDEVHSFQPGDVVSIQNDHRNFVASFELPALNNFTSAGICFRGSVPFINDGGYPGPGWEHGYFIQIMRAAANTFYLDLLDLYEGGTLIERVLLRGATTAYTPTGTVKVSVQDDLFSVWLNGRYLHTFQSNSLSDGKYMAFTSTVAASFRIHLSKLDDLLADIVVGTRGNGMSVLSELLADRHILWRDEPDGSMYFYRTREWFGILPDIVSAVSDVKTDSMVTRMRAEGLQISEVLDSELIRNHGNTFVTVNARHANSVEETRREARLLIDEAWRDAQPKRYALVPHPGIQPGDACGFIENPADGAVERIIRSQSISVGFSGNNFIADMQCDVVPCERF